MTGGDIPQGVVAAHRGLPLDTRHTLTQPFFNVVRYARPIEAM